MKEEYLKGFAYFMYYDNGCLWYEAGRHSTNEPITFAVPIIGKFHKLEAVTKAEEFKNHIEEYFRFPNRYR